MAGSINEKILLYAEDTAILVSDKRVHATEVRLGTALETISVWLIENKLSLHLDKTESILSGTKRKLSNCRNLNVSCNVMGSILNLKLGLNILEPPMTTVWVVIRWLKELYRKQIADWNFSIEMQSSK